MKKLLAILMLAALPCVAADINITNITAAGGLAATDKLLGVTNSTHAALATVQQVINLAGAQITNGYPWTNLTAANPLALTNLDTRAWTNNTGIYGNAVGLTNLNASALASGTVPTARLEATLTNVNITGNAATATSATNNQFGSLVMGLSGLQTNSAGWALKDATAAHYLTNDASGFGIDRGSVSGYLLSVNGNIYCSSISPNNGPTINANGITGAASDDCTFATGTGSFSALRAGSVTVTNTLTATNGIVLPTNAVPPAATVSGCWFFADSTGPCVVIRTGATLVTNRISLTTYP